MTRAQSRRAPTDPDRLNSDEAEALELVLDQFTLRQLEQLAAVLKDICQKRRFADVSIIIASGRPRFIDAFTNQNEIIAHARLGPDQGKTNPRHLTSEEVEILARIFAELTLVQLLRLTLAVRHVCMGPVFGEVCIAIKNAHPRFLNTYTDPKWALKHIALERASSTSFKQMLSEAKAGLLPARATEADLASGYRETGGPWS